MPFKWTAKDITDRRDAHRKWLRENYLDEFTDVWRAVNCKTAPIMIDDPETGTRVEDEYRTNICNPELALIAKRKTARLTANPPQINYITASGNKDLENKLTALRFQQFDKSGEFKVHIKHVQQAVTFGFSLKKHYWDTVQVNRQFRYSRTNVTDRARVMQSQGRQSVLGMQGVNPDEIPGMVQELGSQFSPEEIQSAVGQLGEQLTPQEVSQAIAMFGPELPDMVPVKKYEGPCAKVPFFTDCFWEPGVEDFNSSSFAGEDYTESDLFLRQMVSATYEDPETKQEVPVFDKAKVQELLDTGGVGIGDRDRSEELKNVILSAGGMAQARLEKRLLPNKRFRITECHEMDDNGWMWVTYTGNDRIELGCQPYPFDLYGKYMYTPLVPQTNLLNAIGDSSPRMLRFLHKMHNATVGRRQDLVQNALQPLGQVPHTNDIPQEEVRLASMKIIVSKTPITWVQQPNIPAQAYEEEAQILRMMAMYEPSLNTVDTGTASNPMAGKLATTAILNAKSADALTNAELMQLNLSLKEENEKVLWMTQQVPELGQKMEIGAKYIKTESASDSVKSPLGNPTALSSRYGKTVAMSIDPEEIQEDIQVEPEAGSMLAVDDEMKKQAAMEFFQIASANPDVFSKPYAAEIYGSTIRGVDISQAIVPPQPIPPFKNVNLSVTAKLEDFPAPLQATILGQAGLQVTPEAQDELQSQDQLKAVGELSQAADHATNLTSPAQPPEDPSLKREESKVNKAIAK